MKLLKIIKLILKVFIFEGEKKYTRYNHLLGKLEMSGIPPKKNEKLKLK